jgi:hypothetical protein
MAQVQPEQNTTGGPSRDAGPRDAGQGANRKTAEGAGEAARNFADAASNAGDGAARANAEVLHKSVETTGQAVQAGLKMADTTLQGFADTISRTFGLGDQRAVDLAEQSAANARTVSEATAALARGAQEACREWIDFAHRGTMARLDAAHRLAGCRSAPDLIAVHTELWRESVHRTVTASQAIARTSLKAIEDAERVIQPR